MQTVSLLVNYFPLFSYSFPRSLSQPTLDQGIFGFRLPTQDSPTVKDEENQEEQEEEDDEDEDEGCPCDVATLAKKPFNDGDDWPEPGDESGARAGAPSQS